VSILLIISILVGIIGIWQRCVLMRGVTVLWAMRHPTEKQRKQLTDLIAEKEKEVDYESNAMYLAIEADKDSIIRAKAQQMLDAAQAAGCKAPSEPSCIALFWGMATTLTLKDVRGMIAECNKAQKAKAKKK